MKPRSPAGDRRRSARSPCSASISTVHGPMSGIAQQPARGRLGARRSRARRPSRPRGRRGPAATSAAARRSAIARLGARSKRRQPRGRRAATAAAHGPSRSPVSAQRCPSTAIIRRWIATARSNSISCSVTAASSASHGTGRRRTRRRGCARTALPITGSSRKRVVERAQVVVDAGREAHPRDPLGRRLPPCRARAANSTRSARRLHDADEDRARRRGAAAAAATRRAGASGRRPTRRRAGTATAAPPRPEARSSGRGAHRRAQSRRSRWTSTRNEFEATISPSPFLAFLRLRRGTRLRRRCTTATVAAPGDEAGRRQRGRLAGGHGRGQRRLDHRGGRRDRAARRRPLRPRASSGVSLTNPTA